jgi:hypothetical protein
LFWGHSSQRRLISGNEWWENVNGWHPKNAASLATQRKAPSIPYMKTSPGVGKTNTPTVNTDKMKAMPR